MTAGRRRAHQAVRPSLLKGEREVQGVGGELTPMLIPLVGEDAQA